MRFISWNIDSLNAALTGTSDRALKTRALLTKIAEMDADFLAIQETKLPEAGMNKKQKEALTSLFPDYQCAFISSRHPARKGYAGVMLLYKDDGIKISCPDIGAPEPMDQEGRILTAENEHFLFTCVYTPNAGEELKRLPERQIWDEKFRDYLTGLSQEKPVIVCGDFNVAHEEIDLKNPAQNHHSAGFTDEERQGFTELLDAGFIDSFRQLYPEMQGAYTWWSQRIRTSKINNAGWRIDYFLLSRSLEKSLKASGMVDSGERQDHAPIYLEMEGAFF